VLAEAFPAVSTKVNSATSVQPRGLSSCAANSAFRSREGPSTSAPKVKKGRVKAIDEVPFLFVLVFADYSIEFRHPG
jgi:hypothetical protein